MKTDWKDLLQNSLSEEDKKEIDDIRAKQAAEPKSVKKQQLRIELDKRQKGKIATLITGFEGEKEELEKLAKTLKIKCGSGGSCRDGEILIQGDVRNKVETLLNEMGHKTRKI
jgi:translation initiation factor 1